MASLAYVTGVIVRRLGHSRASAAAIAELLSPSERDFVELATRDVGATVQIAALIYGARKRAAGKLTTPEARRQALAAAGAEAADHYRQICTEPEPVMPRDSTRRPRSIGVITVPDPDVADLANGGR